MDKHTQHIKEHEINGRLGQRIRVLRKQRKMSQRDIANFFGVTPQQVQKWESGRNRLSAARLKMLCCFFDIPLSEFFFYPRGDGS